MSKEFISGKEIMAQWNLEPSELMRLIDEGQPRKVNDPTRDNYHLLTPYHPASRTMIETGVLWTHTDMPGGPRPTLKEFPQYHLILPRDVYDVAELYPFLSECLFLRDQVEEIETNMPAFLKNKKIQGAKLGGNNPSSITDSGYIQKRRVEGAHDAIIAYELCKKDGPFKLTFLNMARVMGLANNYQPGQIDAIKKCGERLYKKGEKMARESKKEIST
jgi:hypothetical protein